MVSWWHHVVFCISIINLQPTCYIRPLHSEIATCTIGQISVLGIHIKWRMVIIALHAHIFYGHFPGEQGAAVNFFTCRMPFILRNKQCQSTYWTQFFRCQDAQLSPNQHCQCTEGNCNSSQSCCEWLDVFFKPHNNNNNNNNKGNVCFNLFHVLWN